MNDRGRSFSSVFFFIVMLFTTAVNSEAAQAGVSLAGTGQVNCFDSSGGVIACANTGQDGELQKGVAWPNPRFVRNSDTSITDTLTGLIWADNGNLLASRDPQWEKGSPVFEGAVTWQHALDYVRKLNAENYLGHNDWRVPNFNELDSLVNRAVMNTAVWLNTQGFVNAQAGDYYWSSTSHMNDPSKAWVVDLNFGNVKYFNKTNGHQLWPVRGGR